MKIDFFARRVHYVDHMAPVWRELSVEARGSFFVPESIVDHTRRRGVEAVGLKARGHDAMDVVPGPPAAKAASPQMGDPSLRSGRVLGGEGASAMLVCSYGDLSRAYGVDPRRRFVFMEHGVGHGYSGHPGYAGGKGKRAKVSLFLAPNEFVRARTERVLPGVKQVVIGTPKMDGWKDEDRRMKDEGASSAQREKVVCISFHWNGEKIAPEAGNAFAHYKRALPELARCGEFKLIGHGHPRAMEYFAQIYEKMEIEVVRDFEAVMERADVYVNDISSTLYEFCVTGKPVVMLNAPWFRRNVTHGIRFWDYTDIGLQVDEPGQLKDVILRTLECPGAMKEERGKMIRELYPFLGGSAKRAAEAVEEWLSEVSKGVLSVAIS